MSLYISLNTIKELSEVRVSFSL